VLQGINLNLGQQAAVVAFLQALVDPRASQGVFPFDRPTLRSEQLLGNASLYGVGAPGSGGMTPQWISNSPPALASADFKVGLRSALGGAPAWLAISPVPSSPGTFISGIPIHLDFPTITLYPVGLSGVGVGGGYATLPWSIPAIPSAVGVQIFGQWLVGDPAGISGFSTTRGLHLTLF
jgi:hypothetical protein